MSTTLWIQLLGIIFGCLMGYFTFVKYKRKELNRSEFVWWCLGWVMLMILAVFPNFLDFIIAPLNFYRRLDFFVVIGFFVLLGLAFYNYSTVKKLERKLIKFVQHDAIKQQRELKKETHDQKH